MGANRTRNQRVHRFLAAARASHIMSALNLALNADFEKKSIKKSIIAYFSSIICTFANRNGLKTGESVVKT